MTTNAQRWTVFTIHGDKCYMCAEPIDFATFEVDHIIPESLAKQPQEWAAALEKLGRPSGFEVNSYENWLPACRRCNREKLAKIWDPSPLIQQRLQRAADNADKAREFEKKTASKKKMLDAVGLLLAAYEKGEIIAEVQEQMAPLVDALSAARPDLEPGHVIRLTPDYEVPLHRVLSDNGHMATVQGPYGVGGGPSPERPGGVPEGMSCLSCGFSYFNGSRCVICGALDDGD